jgi:hypothetical protein
MAAVGGDIIEVTYNHPTVGQGVFLVKANEDATIIRGGFKTNDDANQVDGRGTPIIQKNRSVGSIELPPITWDMIDQDELDKLQQMSNSALPADWTISHISGAIWGGSGWVVGDLSASTNTALITVKINFANDGPKKIS